MVAGGRDGAQEWYSFVITKFAGMADAFAIDEYAAF